MIGRLKCWWGAHDLKIDTLPRLFILDDSWPPRYTDGLPAGVVLRCTRCRHAEVE